MLALAVEQMPMSGFAVVRRLIQTTSGTVMLDLNRWGRGLGVGVRVTRFDPDGWEDEGRAWYEAAAEETNQTLAQLLAVELSVPGPEATALEGDILGPWLEEWKARGGEKEARQIGRLALALVTGLALLLVLACVGVALLVWLLVT